MFLLWKTPWEIYLAISTNFFEMLRSRMYFFQLSLLCTSHSRTRFGSQLRLRKDEWNLSFRLYCPFLQFTLLPQFGMF